MPLTVSCEECHNRMEVHDHAAGTVVRCRACGTLIQVPGAPEKICFSCGGNLSMQKRVRDQSGNYWCHPCWETHYRTMTEQEPQLDLVGTNEDSGEPAMLETIEADSADDMEEVQEEQAYCSRCRHGFATREMFNIGGRYVCRRCVNSSVGKWGFRVVAAGVVVAIAWTAVSVILPAMKKRTAKNDDPEPVPSRIETPRTNVTPAPTADRPPAPVASRGPSGSEMEASLRRNFNAAASAAAVGTRDYSKLLALARERQELFKTAARGASPLIDQWLDDGDTIRKARQHVARTRYSDAVQMLRERIIARYGSAAPVSPGVTPTGRAPDFLNGELGVAMVEAALAAVVVEDKWLMDRGEMSALLRVVAERDPASVKALVMQGWLVYADPAEELLRLDARQSLLDRNRLLLPIRTSLTTRVPNYEDAADFEFFQQKLDAIGDIPQRAFREVMAPLDYSLGLSRKRIEDEYITWTSYLSTPNLVLKDKSNYTYRLIEGYLWKQLPRSDGGFEWQLMVPPPPGSRPGEKWTPYKINVVLWRGPDAEVPDALRDLVTRVERTRPLPLNLTRIAGHSLLVYEWQNLSPSRLFEQQIPFVFSTMETVRQGWTASNRMDRAEAGKKLFIEHRHAEQWFKRSLGATTQALGTVPFIVVPLKPLTVVLEPQEQANVELFDTTGGQLHFISSDGQQVMMKPGYMLGLSTPGGSSVNILFHGSHFNTEAVRSAVARVVRQARNEGGWGAIAELRNDIREQGDMSQRSLEELLVDAIAPPPDALPNSVVIKPSTQTRDPWWAVSGRHLDIVREVRHLFCKYPHGFNRNRLVRLRATGGNAAPVPAAAQEERWRGVQSELQFLDENGDFIPQFYSLDEFRKLLEDAHRDFTRPANRMVPSPFIVEQAGVFDETLQNFLLAKAEQWRVEGDYHAASAFYREIRLPPFTLQAFDASKPRNRQEFTELLRDITRRASSGKQKLESRLAHAQVLSSAGRQMLADALIETARAEWQIAGLPLLEDLRRYSESYGYAPSPDFDRAASDIRNQIGNAFDSPLPGPPRRDAAVRFEAEQARANGNAYLETFYDAKPPYDEYRRAKQWILENDRRLLMRRPRSDGSAHLLFWAPLTIKSDPRLKPGERPETNGPRQLTVDEIFGAPAQGATSGLADHWLRIIYAVETGDPSDYSEARRLLILLAAGERNASRGVSSASAEAQTHTLNAIGAMTIACVFDANLPKGFGTARFDPFVLESAELELQTFVRPRLVAAGLSAIEIADMVDPINDMMTSARGTPVEYAELRYYWSEYAPVVDDYRAFRKGAPKR